MEFASEMIAKATWAGITIAEVPINFYPDQRGRKPHLRTLKDGWRHLQLMFHFCSFKWFLVPGSLLTALSYLIIIFNHIRIQPLISYFIALLLNILGTQILLIGIISQGRVRGSKFKYYPSKIFKFASKIIKVEVGTVLGLLSSIVTAILSILTGLYYSQTSFFLSTLAFIQSTQILFNSVLIGLFGIRVSEDEEFFSTKEENT